MGAKKDSSASSTARPPSKSQPQRNTERKARLARRTFGVVASLTSKKRSLTEKTEFTSPNYFARRPNNPAGSSRRSVSREKPGRAAPGRSDRASALGGLFALVPIDIPTVRIEILNDFLVAADASRKPP
jgi:hypothetical protein